MTETELKLQEKARKLLASWASGRHDNVMLPGSPLMTCDEFARALSATPASVSEELMDAARNVIDTYARSEDGNGEPCPDIARLRTAWTAAARANDEAATLSDDGDEAGAALTAAPASAAEPVNKIDPRHFEILTEAMAEVKATSDGLSDQPIADIVAGCLAEIEALGREPLTIDT